MVPAPRFRTLCCPGRKVTATTATTDLKSESNHQCRSRVGSRDGLAFACWCHYAALLRWTLAVLQCWGRRRQSFDQLPRDGRWHTCECTLISGAGEFSCNLAGSRQRTFSGSASIPTEPFASRTGRWPGKHQAYFLCALSFFLGMPFPPPRPEKGQVVRLWPSVPQFEHTISKCTCLRWVHKGVLTFEVFDRF